MGDMDTSKPPRVLIISSEDNFGNALASVLGTDEFQVELASTSDTPAELVGSRPSIVVLAGSGVDPSDIVEIMDDIPLLVVGPTADAGAMIASVDAGAFGYADIDAPLDELVESIRSVVKGVAVIPPQLLGALLRHVIERQRRHRAARKALNVLTPRERQVFEMSARGLDKAAVAAELFISPDTVRTHFQNVFRKLSLHSQSDLVGLAAECGLEIASASRSDPL